MSWRSMATFGKGRELQLMIDTGLTKWQRPRRRGGSRNTTARTPVSETLALTRTSSGSPPAPSTPQPHRLLSVDPANQAEHYSMWIVDLRPLNHHQKLALWLSSTSTTLHHACTYVSVSFNSYALQILVQFQSEIPFVCISTNEVVECHNCISHEGDSAAWFALKLK